MDAHRAEGAAVAAVSPGGRPDGPLAFVFVHGAGADASRFRALLPLVPGALAIDLPGHGVAGGPACDRIEGPRGYVEAVLALMAREGLERPILVGHSMGGAIALACALSDAAALGGLALVGSGARLRVHPDFLAALRERRVPDGLASLMFAPDADAALVAGEAAALETACARGLLYTDFAACDAFDAQDRVGELRLPAAVVVGSQDRMTPPRLSERLIAGWGEAAAVEGTVVDGAGHYVQLERPEAVARALLRLRERLTGGTGG